MISTKKLIVQVMTLHEEAHYKPIRLRLDDGSVCSPPTQEMEVEKIIYHQNYGKPKPFQNDIALIILTKNVSINDYVSLVCLPFLDDEEEYSTSGFGEKIFETTVAGWGATTGRVIKTFIRS